GGRGGPGGERRLRALDRGELLAQVLAAPLVEFVLVEIGGEVRRIELVAFLTVVDVGEAAQRPLDPPALRPDQRTCAVPVHPSRRPPVVAVLIEVPTSLGYPLLFALVGAESAGALVPGETALIVAAALAADGNLSLPVVIAVAASAAIAGDNLGYLLGRRGL